MDENKNKRLRPRRSVDDIGESPKRADDLGEPIVPKRPAAVEKPEVKTAKEEPIVPKRPIVNEDINVKEPEVKLPEFKSEEPSASPVVEEPEENEKTRLTDVQPKAKLKTPVRQEKKPKRESSGTLSGIFKAILYITLVLVVAAVLAYYIVQFGNDIFAFDKSEEMVEVVIPKNATVNDVADILGEREVIKYPFLFKLYAKLMEEDGVDENGKSVFIPGTYEVSPMNNYMQLLPFFKEKAKPREVVWVTFPEGATVEEMITVLVDDYGISTRDDFKKAINEYDYGFDFLEGLDTLEGRYYRLEGYLFPDTYQFYTDSSAETVVYKMLKNFKDKLEYLSTAEKSYKDRLDELGMTLDEVVTLASMIEKEVKYPIDYDQVSSVFHNRLNNSASFSLLGSDATTVYAIMMETGMRLPSATLTKEDINFDSPYNTRIVKGMPPGAIANPGFEALYSAFYPAKTKYYYFVADSNGYNLYAQTEAGHEKNKASIKEGK